MTSTKRVAANRLNARKSTGPRTALGKQRSRCNALRHGVTAETVIAGLECAADYRALEASLTVEHSPGTATERHLVSRLASVLWRLRRATQIETGLFAAETELIQEAEAASPRRITQPAPEWLDEIDRVKGPIQSHDVGFLLKDANNEAKELASCFVRLSRLGYGTFDLLHRYETALWRQAAQILLLLRSTKRL